MTSPLRVAYVLTQDRGGPVDLCVNLATALAGDESVAVRIFGPTPARGAEAVRDLHTPLDIPRKGDVAAFGRARSAILGWRPDVVHGQDRRSGLVVAGLRALAHASPATVHTYHGVPDDVTEPWFRLSPSAAPPSRYSRAVLAADAAVARIVRRTTVPSTAMVNFLRWRLRVPAARLVHVDNGVKLPSPGPPRGPVRKLLFVGLLIERKGVADLLSALARPGTAPPDATLSIVGDGPERARLEHMARTGPLSGRVSFLGFRTDVHDLLHRHDAVVLPSHMEQQPLVVAEAMGAARPVVATDTGGVAEILAVPGLPSLLVPPRDVVALAGALRTLFDEPDPSRLGRALAQRAQERYSIGRAAESHLELYTRLRHETAA